MAARPDPTLVDIQVFARLVGAAPGEIEGLLKTGTLRKAAPGKLALIESVRAFIAHTRASARDASAAAAQADARVARAEASELSLAVQNRDLLPDTDADAALLHIAGTILETLGGLSARVTRDRSDRSLIEDALRAVQTGIADGLVALATLPSACAAGCTPERPSRAQDEKGDD